MITPFFKLTQDDTYLIISIRAPNANIGETEIEFFDRLFLFSSAPYFLRLHLPGDVSTGAHESSEYDSDKGEFVIRMKKIQFGAKFPNLDMLSELMKPQKPNSDDDKKIEDLDDVPDDLFVEQKLPTEDQKLNEEQIERFGYGFGWHRYGVLEKFGNELDELFEPGMSGVEVDERTEELERRDERSFDSEHYLADLFDETPELSSALELNFHPNDFDLNDEDRLQLKDLRIRKLENLDVEKSKRIAYSLIDILFAYLFDLRSTDGEHNACSDQMIVKLSPTLSGLVRFGSASSALSAVVRRCLCYPLFRRFDLCVKVAADIRPILQNRQQILHCLLTLRKRFHNSGRDFFYLFNQLLIDDLCLWLQSAEESLLNEVNDEYADAVESFGRAEVSALDLDYIEAEAKMIALKVESGDYDSDD